MNYGDFLKSKEKCYIESGFDCTPSNKFMFDFQRDVVRWALKKGKAALFLDTGLGKTLCQLVWADEVFHYTKGNVLILAPLAVSKQTVAEGKKFGINANICRTQADVKEGINITNYEMLEHFNPSVFIGVVLDESSIIKSFTGKTTQNMIELFKYTPYKLACSATPAPNDYEELGNHSEFLGIMSRVEMLATFFVHDGGDTAKWRLKGHAENDFWKWIASWAMIIKDPSDLGYDSTKYILPKLNIITHIIPCEADDGMMFAMPAKSLDERRKARKESLQRKVIEIKKLTEKMDCCLIWCDYNDESDSLSKAILGAIEVKGADTNEHKEGSMLGFAQGNIKFLVTKPKIAGFGMNWQVCNNVIFCGLSDSYEQYYQSIRRCYRFGQTKDVNVYIVITEKEISVLENIKRKEQDAIAMGQKMVSLTSEILKGEIKHTKRETIEYKPHINMVLPNWKEFKNAG